EGSCFDPRNTKRLKVGGESADDFAAAFEVDDGRGKGGRIVFLQGVLATVPAEGVYVERPVDRGAIEDRLHLDPAQGMRLMACGLWSVAFHFSPVLALRPTSSFQTGRREFLSGPQESSRRSLRRVP